MFKPGDKVKRTGENFDGILRGRIYTVVKQHSSDDLELKGHGNYFMPEYFELVKTDNRDFNTEIVW